MIALLVAALQQEASSFASVQTLQLAGALRAQTAMMADFDGDGTREVLVAAHTQDKAFARELQIWRAAEGAASLFLAETLPLTRDVVSFAVGDVREGGGDEIVLFNPGGAFSWRPSGPPDQRLERIAECDLLWQTQDAEHVFPWDGGVRDLDGDGLVDLILPEPGGFALCRQQRPRAQGATWGAVSRVRVPEEDDEDGVWLSASKRGGPAVRGRRSRRSLSIQLGGGGDDDESPSVLVSASESVPAPQWLDWNGDGRLDLVAQTSHHLHAWLQDAGGRFAAGPALSLALPVAVDKNRRLDASYSSHAVDLDHDRRADCVIFAGDKRSDDVRTQGLFFAQSAVKEGPALFGEGGRPRDVLVFAGFVSEPTFLDLDLDDYPELVLRSVRPDLIDQIRSASSQSIEASLFVYRNRRGVLSRQPDVVWRHSIPLQRFQVAAEFGGDLTGDGLSELFVRDRPDRLRVMFLRAQGTGDKSTWTLMERPLWELAVSERADVEIVPAAAGAKPELLVIEPAQVLHVRFR